MRVQTAMRWRFRDGGVDRIVSHRRKFPLTLTPLTAVSVYLQRKCPLTGSLTAEVSSPPLTPLTSVSEAASLVTDQASHATASHVASLTSQQNVQT